MSKVTLEDTSLYGIGNAIRAKLGVSTQYKPEQMAGAIESIPSGSTPALGTKSITQNGTYAASGDNLDGYSSVEVNVSGGSATLIAKNISQNGSYTASGDSADGYSSVTVNVPNSYAAGDEGKVVQNGALVAQTARASEITANGTYDTTNNDSVVVNVSGGGNPDLGTKTITENGTYAASSDNLDGYSSVTVNVPSTTVKRVKLGSTSTILNTSRIVSSGANRLDYVIPVDSNGQEVEIDITKDFEICIKFMLTQSIASQAWLYLFGEKIPSSNNEVLPMIALRYDSGVYQGYIHQNTDASHSHTTITLLTGYSAVPTNTWITVKAKRRTDLQYDLTVKIGNTTYTENDVSVVNISYTGSYVPVIGADDTDGYGATLASTPGTIIEIGECYIKQENTVIW